MEKIRMQSVNLQKANAVMAEVKKAVIGKDTCILKVMAAMIAGGHILLDDIPGFFKGHGFKAESCSVYTGYSSGRYCRIFHV